MTKVLVRKPRLFGEWCYQEIKTLAEIGRGLPKTGTPTTTLASRRALLGAFLRERREALDPKMAGVECARRRLAKGLRREEVAERAAIGAGWYTWLEQGRPINVSDETLHRIAVALQLNSEETAYMFGLANKLLSAEPVDRLIFEAPRPIVATILTHGGPAVAVNYRFDVLAWNELANRIYHLERTSFDGVQMNYVWRLYNDPTYRSMFCDWDRNAISITAILRTMFASCCSGPDTVKYAELLTALKDNDDFLRHAGTEHRVGRSAAYVLALNVEPVGVFNVYSVRLTSPSVPGIIVFLQSPVDEDSQRALRKLAAT